MAQKAEIRSKFPEKVKTVLKNFWGMALIFSLLTLILRGVEFYLIFSKHVLDFSLKDVIFHSIIEDLRWVIFFLGMLFIIHILISLIHSGFSKILILMLLGLTLILDVGLIFYFTETLVPLGQDLFAYSWDDIYLTVSASGQLNIFNSIIYTMTLIAVFGILYLGIKWLNISLKTLIYLTLGFLIMVAAIQFLPKRLSEDGSEVKSTIELNKSRYLVEESFDLFIYGGEFYFDFFLRSSNKNMIVKKEYEDGEYPFMHQAEYPDVLTPFFDSIQSPPNLIFILAESFGKAYSGKNAYLGSFTPFLDSLEDHSLVWEHNISTTGRTFGILPAILGGYPFGEKGFLELYEEFPYHQSLISILKKNGYTSRFFTGSDKKFDHQSDFLEFQNIDFIEDEFTFLDGYDKTPSKTGFSWGYPDKVLFLNALRKLPEVPTAPELLIFQTITSHSPYIVPEDELYNQKFDNYLSKVLKLSPEKINEYQSYKNIYKTILYADDAIRIFIEGYKKRPDYQNTIFIITGDHRLPEIPMASRLDRFHVPLIVFSPLLKKPDRFLGMSSHFEIAPTLLAFLKNNNRINIPEDVVWMGQVLDTARNFQSRLVMPLMRNKSQLIEYLSSDYFLSDGQVFKISEGLNIDPIDEPDLRTQLIGEFEDFKNKNNYMVQTRKLLRPLSSNLAEN